MAEQKDLFGFSEMRPKLSLKKIITKERIQEVQKLLEDKKLMTAEQRLRELRYDLEKLERRISHGAKQ
jgi:hypothetical protein